MILSSKANTDKVLHSFHQVPCLRLGVGHIAQTLRSDCFRAHICLDLTLRHAPVNKMRHLVHNLILRRCLLIEPQKIHQRFFVQYFALKKVKSGVQINNVDMRPGGPDLLWIIGNVFYIYSCLRIHWKMCYSYCFILQLLNFASHVYLTKWNP